MKYIISAFGIFILSCTFVYGHEMTPTYPKLRPSFVGGLYSTKLNLFNRREDATYYEIQVFDDNWDKIPFASSSKIIELQYLDKKEFEIYIRSEDLNRITYICTVSKIIKDESSTSKITSKICSKIKRD